MNIQLTIDHCYVITAMNYDQITVKFRGQGNDGKPILELEDGRRITIEQVGTFKSIEETTCTW